MMKKTTLIGISLCIMLLGLHSDHLSVSAENFAGREDEYTEKCSDPSSLTKSEIKVCSEFSDYLKKKNDSLESDIANTQSQLTETMKNIDATNAQLAETEKKITSVQSEIEILDANIKRLTKDIENKEQQVADRMYVLQSYINGNELTNLLLSSANFDELLTRVQCIDELTTYDKELIISLARDKADLEIKSAEAQKRYDELFILQSQQTSLIMALNQEATVYQNSIDENYALINSYREDIGFIDTSLSEAERRIQAEEERKREEERQKQLQQQQQQQKPSNNNSGSSNQGSSNGGSNSKPSQPAGNIVSALASTALSKVGCSYVYGATGPNSFDCSGLAQWVYRQNGIYIPRTVTTQYYACTLVSSPDVGDLVYFNTIGYMSHVGIYIGNGQFVHAGTSATGVVVANLYSSYWQSVYLGAGRFR